MNKRKQLYFWETFLSQLTWFQRSKKPSYFCYDSHSVGKNKVALPHNPESRRSFSYIILTVSCKSRPKKFTMIPLFLIASATILAWSGVAPQPWAKNIVGRDCICHKASHKPLLWTHLHCWYLLISCCDHLFGRCIHGEGLAVSLVSLWEEENLCLWCLLNFSQEASKLKRHFFTASSLTSSWKEDPERQRGTKTMIKLTKKAKFVHICNYFSGALRQENKTKNHKTWEEINFIQPVHLTGSFTCSMNLSWILFEILIFTRFISLRVY